MCGTHLRTEMYHTYISFRGLCLFRNRLVKIPCLCREVHDTEHIADLLGTAHNRGGDCIHRNAAILANVFNPYAPKSLKHLSNIAREVRMDTHLKGNIQLCEWRLRRGAEDGSDTAKILEKIHRSIEKIGAAHRKCLYLIKDNDAVPERMQSAQRSVASIKQSVEKLYLRCKDDRNIPPLRQNAPSVHTLRIFPIVLHDNIRVMFQNCLIHPENIANLFDVLIDDRGIWDDDDDALLMIFLRMPQCKAHTCKSLAAPRRNA